MMNNLLKKIWNKQIDVYFIKNESSVRRNLWRLKKWLSWDIEYAINHEKAHYNQAKLLHHFPKYGVEITRKTFLGIKFAPSVAPFVEFENDVPPKDRIKIALAPKTPSRGDYYLAYRNGYLKEVGSR